MIATGKKWHDNHFTFWLALNLFEAEYQQRPIVFTIRSLVPLDKPIVMGDLKHMLNFCLHGKRIWEASILSFSVNDNRLNNL